MSLLPVEGYHNYKKDTSSGGVINTDTNSYNSYIQARNVALQKHQQQKEAIESIGGLQQQINNINTDIEEIKSLLVQLIKKGN